MHISPTPGQAVADDICTGAGECASDISKKVSDFAY